MQIVNKVFLFYILLILHFFLPFAVEYFYFLGTWFTNSKRCGHHNGHVGVVDPFRLTFLGGNNRSTALLSSAYPRLPPFSFRLLPSDAAGIMAVGMRTCGPCMLVQIRSVRWVYPCKITQFS